MAGLRLLCLPNQDAGLGVVAGRTMPDAAHPGPTAGGAGLARPVRGARRAGDGRARDGAGSRRALAAAGDAGATCEPAPRQGGAAPADRAAHGSLPCWRRAAERVRAPPTGRRGSAGRARWPGTRAHPRHGSSGRNRSPCGSCRGVLPARAAGPGAGGFRPQAGAAGTAHRPHRRHRRNGGDPLRHPRRTGG